MFILGVIALLLLCWLAAVGVRAMVAFCKAIANSADTEAERRGTVYGFIAAGLILAGLFWLMMVLSK